MKSEGGFALVLTLIVTALLVALSAEFVSEVFVDTSARQNFVDGQQASVYARSGVEAAVKGLQQMLMLRPSYTTLADIWATPYQAEVAKGKLRVVIEDETGKLCMNRIASPTGELTDTDFYYATAVRLLKRLKLQPFLLEAVADWVGSNETPHPNGAKTPYYATLKPPYQAKGALLDTVEELRLVKGFDAATFEALRPFVTVYGVRVGNVVVAAPININTAPKEVIVSLAENMSDSLADAVIDYRKTTPFTTTGELANVPGMATIAQSIQTNIIVRGLVYRIRAEATVGETTRTIEAVVDLSSSGLFQQVPYLYWREY